MASLPVTITKAICCWVPKRLPALLGRQLRYQTLAGWACPVTKHCMDLPTTQIRTHSSQQMIVSVQRLFARKFTSTSSATPWKILSYGYPSTCGYSPMLNQLSLSETRMQVRTVTRCSKNKGKRKTVKAVAKRFIRTGSGKLKYWPPGNVHNMLAKSRKKRLQLRKAKYVTKTQLKTLNKMISGW